MGKSPKGVVVQLKGPIKRGDGIVLDRGKKRCYKGRERKGMGGKRRGGEWREEEKVVGSEGEMRGRQEIEG